MLGESGMKLVRDRGSKLGRVLMGLLFFVSGVGIVMGGSEGIANTAGFYKAVGVPLAGVLVYLVIALKIVAGGAIMLGKRVTEAAAALIVFTLIATLLAHMDFKDPDQLTAALKNLAIVGGLLYLMSFGPGGVNITNDGIRD